MITKFRLLVGLLLLAPTLAHALGLGDIRLGSALNQPMSADIEIVGASADELGQVRAALASRDAFAHAGVDAPQFLSALTFTVAKDSGGRPVVQVRSTQPITEPFVTFLVELNWPRGHLVREYTVLLDPPVFEAKPTPAPAVAAPVTGETTSAAAGSVVRGPAENGPSAESAAAATTPAAASAVARSAAAPASTVSGGEYRVVAKDSLSSIARRSGASTPPDINRLMIATYRANPSAFDGNINRLRKGAVLRIPGSDEWSALSAADAAREVRRQVSEWRGSAGAARTGAAEEARLRLVPPTEAPAGRGTAPAPAAAAGGDTERVAALEKELAETKRLLDLKSAELARLQSQAQAPAPAATPPAPVPLPAPPAAAPPAEAPAPAAVETPKPAAAEAPAPAEKPKAPPPPAAPGLLGTLADNLLYVILGGAALLLGALLGFNVLRRRREEADFDEVLQPGSGPETAPRGLRGAEASRGTIVVEESGEFEAPPLVLARPAAKAAPPPAPAPAPAPARSLDDTLSSDSAVNLEQADPLAEADFHMAYGLYDQAADIVKLAITREPDNRALKLKLLEVYFVWGNKDAFLEVARTLARTRDGGAAGEWDKVVIMGRQIAGDDPLFAGAGPSGAATDLDLDLEGSGTQGVDLEFLGEAPAPPRTGRDSVDLDLGQALGGADGTADTGESKTLDPERFDMLLDEPPTDHGDAASGGRTAASETPTVEQPELRGVGRDRRPSSEAPTVEQPRLRGADAPTVEQPRLRGADAPTVETPALVGRREHVIGERLGSALGRERSTATDATAELQIDDLGFDVGTLGSTSTSLEALKITDHPSDSGAGSATMVTGLDQQSRDRFGAADATVRAPGVAADAASHAPGAEALDLDLEDLTKALEGDTVEQPRREEVGFSTDVFATAIRQAPSGLDLDVGASGSEQREPTVTQRVSAEDLALPELEPVTLSEVGTKLDLARAYMDMGDPDGARSILQEVLNEGSSSQKQEAQRLIETLPG
ncbi:MAG TPA: FimV/HubP family polar landmark protein [Steroidobacteraceae bacterium]|nr:FimV/HubP family polar landmark protein [Steroidobacteraceae bacterium]